MKATNIWMWTQAAISITGLITLLVLIYQKQQPTNVKEKEQIQLSTVSVAEIEEPKAEDIVVEPKVIVVVITQIVEKVVQDKPVVVRIEEEPMVAAPAMEAGSSSAYSASRGHWPSRRK